MSSVIIFVTTRDALFYFVTLFNFNALLGID